MAEPLYRGKVREIYAAGENRLFILTGDRVSAFDVVMGTPVPGKGALLNKMSLFWFDYLKDIVPNHLISARQEDFPAPFDKDPAAAGRGMLVKKLKMLPFECIIRGYISGSAWKSYRADGTVCGAALPAGLSESERFEKPLFTPSTKEESGHDRNLPFAEMEDILGAELAGRVREVSLAVYEKAAAHALSKGIIIADTKLEFGLDEDGALTLGDEVLTPDSSRFWPLDSYAPGRGQASFDKQYLRDWLISKGMDGRTPPPALPPEVVSRTYERYAQAFARLAG